jgi:hypothetical protein
MKTRILEESAAEKMIWDKNDAPGSNEHELNEIENLKSGKTSVKKWGFSTPC